MLGEFATQHAVLVRQLQRGDVFLWYDSMAARFHHTGLVLNVTDTMIEYVYTTIEGNTNTDGSPEGTTVLVRTRLFAKTAAHRSVIQRCEEATHTGLQRTHPAYAVSYRYRTIMA